MTTSVLLLNADFRPIKVISWQRAFELYLEEKVDLIAGYAGRFIRSVSLSFDYPAVVRLRRFTKIEGRIRFNRQNLIARDSYRCAYCGMQPRRNGRPDLEELTLDHVIPRAQSKSGIVWLPWAKKHVSITCWENVVTACRSCNEMKADRTPEQAGLRLAAYPKPPTALDVLRMSLARVHIPEEWSEYLPEEWRGYWTAELAAD